MDAVSASKSLRTVGIEVPVSIEFVYEGLDYSYNVKMKRVGRDKNGMYQYELTGLRQNLIDLLEYIDYAETMQEIYELVDTPGAA